MAFIQGKNTKLLINGYDLTGFFNSVSLTTESPALDSSVFGTAYKTYLPGLRIGGSASMDGFWTSTAGEADAILEAAFYAGNDVGVTYLLNGDTAGQPGFGFMMKETSHAVTSSIAELVRVSASGEITGYPVWGLSVAALAQRTNASQTTAGLDLGATASGTMAAAFFNVTQLSSGSVAVTIETASDSGFTTNLGTIATATVTAVGAYAVVEAAMTVRRYVRLKAACSAGQTVTVHGLLQYR